jgi:hypothetical protein
LSALDPAAALSLLEPFFEVGSWILKSSIRIRINVMRIHNTAFLYNIFVRLRPGGGAVPAGEPAAGQAAAGAGESIKILKVNPERPIQR